MNLKTNSFHIAYQSYYDSININSQYVYSVLEVGGGAHPSIKNKNGIEYSIVDPDMNELAKAPGDVIKIHSTIEELGNDKTYNLIISKMVLEHVQDPDGFHKSVLGLLSENGKAIHFFACRHSLPALVNRLLPEFVGDAILRLLKNRDLSSEPKYEAYYQKTNGQSQSQLNYFKKMGYSVDTYHSFVGHKYFKSVPVLSILEKGYTWLLHRMNIYQLATVAIVILEKKELNPIDIV